MRYTAPTDILVRVEDAELAKATSADTTVDGPLLRAVTERPDQASYAGYTAAAIAAARRALAQINAGIDDASGDIDGYIAARYAWTDLADVPQKVKTSCTDIVIWRLLGGASQGDDKSDRFVRYESAIRWLERVEKGEIDLAPGQAEAAPVVVSGDAPVFDRNTLAAY